MTDAGRASLTREATRIRPLTNSNGIVTAFVVDPLGESSAAGAALLELHSSSNVNVAGQSQRSLVRFVMQQNIRSKLTRVTPGMLKSLLCPAQFVCGKPENHSTQLLWSRCFTEL